MTQIEWTHLPGFKGASWNPIVGCSVVSPGCTNCYAMKQVGRILRMTDGQSHYAGTVADSKAGPVWTGKVARASDKAFTAPLRRRIPTCYFVNSMGDLFAESVPDEWIDQVFAVMALLAQHRFIVLTKRPERMRDYLIRQFDRCDGEDGIVDDLIAVAELAGVDWREAVDAWPLPNVWLGVSVEDQARAAERIPLLLDTPAAVRFISAEPLLGFITLTDFDIAHAHGVDCHDALSGCYLEQNGNQHFQHVGGAKLDWVICGGESGPDARPMHPDWARFLRDQCADAGVPYFFKQWGEWSPVWDKKQGDQCPPCVVCQDGEVLTGRHMITGTMDEQDAEILRRIGKRAAGHLLDGVEHFNWPADPAGSAA